MFDVLPSMLRLSLCLLFSVGLHGGLAFYDWVPSSARSRMVHAPVVVSLLPATESVSPLPSGNLQPLQASVPATKALRAAEVESPTMTPQVVPSSPRKGGVKVPFKKTTVEVAAAESSAIVPSAEMVCMAPQEVVFEDLSELFEDGQRDIASARLDTAQEEKSDSAYLSEHESLVEAVPNYRSNPLPEYPHLARQKHWEGVVWLLVDVSAEGSVDDLRVEQSCGYRVLDRAASRTVRRWKFSPALRAGLPVSSQARIPVRFRLEDG